MTRTRTVLTGIAFAALGGSLAWGLLGEAAATRERALLEGIQRAEDTVAFVGRRAITVLGSKGPVTRRIRVSGRDGVRRIDAIMDPGPFAWVERMDVACGEHAGHMARFRNARQILENYSLTRIGRETVAGRLAERYELRPRHPGRPSYAMSTDVANQFLLTFTARSPEGTPVLNITHETIEYDPVFTTRDGPRTAPSDLLRRFCRSTTKEELRTRRFKAWLPKPPAGFEVQSIDLIQVKGFFFFEGILAAYSDGMAWIWVLEFPETLPIWRALRPYILGQARRGERVARRVTCPGQTIMNVTLEGTEIFIAGQLAADEMERVVRTLKKTN